MSILITGADISPDRIQCITVFPEGVAVVEEYEMLLPIKTTKCKVASVPTPHGRLIDADKLDGKIWEQRRNILFMDDTQKADMVLSGLIIAANAIEKSPTVIEAEEGEG